MSWASVRRDGQRSIITLTISIGEACLMRERCGFTICQRGRVAQSWSRVDLPIVQTGRRLLVLDTMTDDHRPTPAHRLRDARLKAGFATVKDFARYIGVNYTMYYRHESGHVEINAESARFYADKLAISPGAILYGEELQLPTEVPIVGVISAGGVIKMLRQDLQTMTTLGSHQALWALIVQGNDLYPAVRDGDKVFFAPLRPEKFSIAAVHGEECVCKLADGTMLLRVVMAGPDGLATLSSYTGPHLYDVKLLAASRIELVERAGYRKPPPQRTAQVTKLRSAMTRPKKSRAAWKPEADLAAG